MGDVVPFACRAGDGDLNVRSVIEPPLFVLCKPPRPPLAPPPATLPLPVELADPRLIMRLVCMLPTGSGVVVCDRNAAAAAAEERAAFDMDFPKKACVAAAAAELDVLLSTG